jgi:hypothetical protein
MNVDLYLSNLPENEFFIADYLHQLILSRNEKITCRIKWGIPVFTLTKDLIYINALKNSVEFVIIRAHKFGELKSLLDFKNRKLVAGLTFSSLKEIDEAIIIALIDEAIEVDKIEGPAFKK